MPSVTMAPRAGQLGGPPHCSHERRGVGHGLVGRRHRQHRVAAALERRQRGQRQCRCGVAPDGFEQQRGIGDAFFTQLLKQQKSVFVVAHDQRRVRRDAAALQRQQAARRTVETG